MDAHRRISETLSRAWFLHAGHADFVAARAVVGLNALWLVLSHPDMPATTGLPAAFWKHVTLAQRARFLAFALPSAIEWILYASLIASLLLVIAGRATTVSAFVAAILLYRFAALEPLIGSTGLLWFQCFTHPVLFLLVIGAAWGRTRTQFDDRWSVATIRGVFALYYFFCGFEKLTVIGPRWISPANIRTLLLVQETREIFYTPLATPIASSTAACWTIAILTVALELLFPLVLFSKVARRILLPAALLGHIGIALALGLVFLNWPLLLLFVDFRMAGVVWNQLRSRSDRPERRRDSRVQAA